ncbi:MAG: replication restart helicase PriA [Myxococcota bacterium]
MPGPLFDRPDPQPAASRPRAGSGSPDLPGPDARVVRVALPVPVDRLFDYAVPRELEDAVVPGVRVTAPFSGRLLSGVVVERADPRDGSEPSSLASIEAVVDPEPVLGSDWMAVLRASAERALCPVGLALQAALPAGAAPRSVREWALTPRGREALARGAVRGEARALLERLARGSATRGALARGAAGARRQLSALARDGLVREQAVLRSGTRATTERFVRLKGGLDVEAACADQLARAPRQADLLRRIAELVDAATPAVDARRLAGGAALRSLAERGLVEIEERPGGGPAVPPTRDHPPELTPDQRRALAPIEGAIRDGRAERFLLHGVTGSGKTEIYLRAVASALAAGRTALVLVPEITLTHQIVARLRARFGDALAVLHSGLRPGERLAQWERLRRGETPIAVGARSALFAPLERLGVIVIDEEHDPAYKNEEGFRYHARDLAARRALADGCPIILGSATPSLETRFAAEQGALSRVVLPRRIGGRPLPAVEIVDLVRERERAPRGRKLVITPPLRRAIRETLDDGGQAILFLNRRGFSTQIMCFECGAAERCKDCDVALVFHASEHRLRCHYCDARRPPPEVCSHCGAPDGALLGVGTERLEEETRSLFPEARIARLDRDTARRRGHTEHILGELREGRIDILVGTQIVAKGHDFPGVRLVGVIAADIGLHLPDFRAAERTFQLLTQVAGRAGRDAAPGRVLVQTFVPDHYAIRPVRDHDYDTFYREEIAHRAALGYPPFGELAQIMVSGEDEDAARSAADGLARVAGDATPAGVEVLGPAPAALARLRRRHRFQILLKGADAASVHAAARAAWLASSELPRGVTASVDVAPISML